MTQKQAKIEALRIVTANISNLMDAGWDFDGFTEITGKEEDKIRKEVEKIRDSIYMRAIKLGGDFNPVTGL